MIKIFDSTYKDLKAVTIENDCLLTQFLPNYGGKMSSLIYKKTGREFLLQAKSLKYKALEYDGNFGAAECSGFDDMFPTIDRVFYPSYPWKGVEIPDHGEVCGLKWDYEVREDSLYMSVYGVRFPYRLEKWITFDNENTLNIAYKATNLCQFDMDFLWTAHPMMDAGDGGEIMLPYSGQQDARIIFTTDERIGQYGDILIWPETKFKDGNKRKMNLVDGNSDSVTACKFYFKEELPEGWCAYRYKSDGTSIRMSFPKDKVPYMGVLVEEHPIEGKYMIILEPCTGTYDRPDLAKLNRQNSVLKANSSYDWFLKFHVE